jgi:hypothetical protein
MLHLLKTWNLLVLKGVDELSNSSSLYNARLSMHNISNFMLQGVSKLCRRANLQRLTDAAKEVLRREGDVGEGLEQPIVEHMRPNPHYNGQHREAVPHQETHVEPNHHLRRDAPSTGAHECGE